MYHELLSKSQFCIIIIDFLLILILGVLNFKTIKKEFECIERKNWMLLILIFSLSFSLIVFISPWKQQTYFDAWSHMEEGKGILLKNNYFICEFGKIEECSSYLTPTWHLIGNSFLLSISFFLFGINEISSMLISLIFGSSSTILIFLVAYLLFNKKQPAFYSAIIFALIPLFIRFSTATTKHIPGIFFSLLLTMFFLLGEKTSKKEINYLTLSIAIFCAYVAWPNTMLFILLFLFFRKNKGAMFLIIFLLAIAPMFISIIEDSKSAEYMQQQLFNFDFDSIDSIKSNISASARFWLYHNPIITLFGIIGIYMLRKYGKIATFLVLWFLSHSILIVVINLNLFSCDLDRYLLYNYLSLTLIVGFGLYGLVRYSNKKFGKRGGLIPILITITALSTSLSIAHSNNECYEWHNSEVIFAKAVKDEIDDSCFIIVHYPINAAFVSHEFDKKIIALDYALDNRDSIEKLLQKGECILFYETRTCLDPNPLWSIARKKCRMLKERYNLNLMYENRPNHWYKTALYSVHLKGNKIVNETIIDLSNSEKTSRKFKLSPIKSEDHISRITVDKGMIRITQTIKVTNPCYVLYANISKIKGHIDMQLIPIRDPSCFTSCVNCPTTIKGEFYLYDNAGSYKVSLWVKGNLIKEREVIIDKELDVLNKY